MFGFPIGNGNAGFNDFVEKFTNNADSGFPKIQQREVFYTIKSGNWNDITIWQTASGRFGILPTSIDDVYIRHSIVANTITTINNLFVSGALSVTVGTALTFNNIRCYGSLINNGGTFRILGNENYIEKSLYQFISGSIEYQGNNQPILDLNYGNLTLSSSGTKYLIQDLFVNGTFTLTSPAIFDAYGYNITIYGSTSITSLMNATGSGSYLFVGNAAFSTSSGINLSGNPSMEFRGGLGFGTGSYTNNLGTGNILFSTNNQSITSGTSGLFFNNPISIASGITLTFPSNTTTTFNSTINGLDATSKLLMGTNTPTINYKSNIQPMITGILDTSTNLNTWIYGLNNQDIKGGPTTLAKQVYSNLTLNGTGVKTLQGYVSVQNTYTLTAPATLALNGYTLTNP